MIEPSKPRLIYFVRHGESEGNVGTTVQTPDEPLTARGREQAMFVGKRFAKDIPIDHILCSTMSRTRETAAIASHEMGWEKDIEYSDLLVERLAPTQFLGVPRTDEVFTTYYNEYKENWSNPDWRHSDEENFFALKARAGKALEYIETFPHEHILVVTHGLFLRFLIGTILFTESLTPEVSLGLIEGMITQNTGVSVAKFDPSAPSRKWSLMTFNDYAHLPK